MVKAEESQYKEHNIAWEPQIVGKLLITVIRMYHPNPAALIMCLMYRRSNIWSNLNGVDKEACITLHLISPHEIYGTPVGAAHLMHYLLYKCSNECFQAFW